MVIREKKYLLRPTRSIVRWGRNHLSPCMFLVRPQWRLSFCWSKLPLWPWHASVENRSSPSSASIAWVHRWYRQCFRCHRSCCHLVKRIKFVSVYSSTKTMLEENSIVGARRCWVIETERVWHAVCLIERLLVTRLSMFHPLALFLESHHSIHVLKQRSSSTIETEWWKRTTR